MRNTASLSNVPGALVAVVLAVLVPLGCRTPVPMIAGIKETQLREWYVPTIDTTGQSRVPFERVAYLDAPPTDKDYRVIGYVYPRSFRTFGETLNASRAAASLYGADAIFVEVLSETEGWTATMSPGSAFAGKAKNVQYRMQAIVWN